MEPDFLAPGPGAWDLDRSHYPGGATPISQWLLVEGFRDGFEKVFEELGIPAQGMAAEFVNGFLYTRLVPLINADKPPKRLPPELILKVATRLHPAFRVRNKAAIATLRDRPSNHVVKRWNNELRPKLQAANTKFQAFEVVAADDVELQSHIVMLLDQLHENFGLHFWLHGHDLGPVARYLHAALGWGLEPERAIAALAGASPATAMPLDALCTLRALLDKMPGPITTLAQLRDGSDQARALVDSYLDERGFVLATGYDLDARTLHEMPEVVLTSIRTASKPPELDHEGLAAELRDQLPPNDQERFDKYLADARNVMDMRDDNGPLTVQWPMGLLRRALLAAGSRLVERSVLTKPELLFEVTPDEARALFDGGLPPAVELSERADSRRRLSKLTPVSQLGRPEPEPPLSVLPPALAELIEMTQVAIDYMGMSASTDSKTLTGVGIGSDAYVGTARVADSADDALDRLEPGEVLVVRATSPAFNAVLAIAGAVVTSDGGLLSHAAVLARELGIPAIIGAAGALDIADGATIEVDPVAGLVTVVH